jgi:hypothetical protein
MFGIMTGHGEGLDLQAVCCGFACLLMNGLPILLIALHIKRTRQTDKTEKEDEAPGYD